MNGTHPITMDDILTAANEIKGKYAAPQPATATPTVPMRSHDGVTLADVLLYSRILESNSLAHLPPETLLLEKFLHVSEDTEEDARRAFQHIRNAIAAVNYQHEGNITINDPKNKYVLHRLGLLSDAEFDAWMFRNNLDDLTSSELSPLTDIINRIEADLPSLAEMMSMDISGILVAAGEELLAKQLGWTDDQIAQFAKRIIDQHEPSRGAAHCG